jgi:dephospho-CoA kinase
VLSTDRVVHDLYGSGVLTEAVVERFGPPVAPNGVIDRAELARRAFASAEDRAWLEGMLWPRVGKQILAWREEVEGSTPIARAAVVEVPLLFEAEMDHAFDATVAIIAEEELRAERAQARGHEALEQRSARQLPQMEKAQRATYVVVNDETVEQLEAKLSAILDKLNER